MTAPAILRPPFTHDTAVAKVQSAEDAWNSRDPERVALAYTPDSEWRNRTEFLRGRDDIRAFLTRKWQKELDYRLKKDLWAFEGNRIAVRFEYEWHDQAGQWYRSYGRDERRALHAALCGFGARRTGRRRGPGRCRRRGPRPNRE